MLHNTAWKSELSKRWRTAWEPSFWTKTQPTPANMNVQHLLHIPCGSPSVAAFDVHGHVSDLATANKIQGVRDATLSACSQSSRPRKPARKVREGQRFIHRVPWFESKDLL